MNDAQCVTISGNFLLIAVTRRGLFFHQLANARACGNNAFDGVGSLGTLNLRNLYQLFQLLRALLKIHLLLSGFFIDGGNQAKYLGIPLLLPNRCVMKFSHCLTSNQFPLNYAIE